MSACADVLVVGVDGNGQRPAKRRHLRAHRAGVRRHVRPPAVRRPLGHDEAGGAAHPPPGRPDRRDTGPAGPRWPRSRRSALRQWSAPVRPGTTKLMRVLDAAAARCPEQQFVLVGYAQGAKVAHLGLIKARKRSYADRMAAGVLISDPARRRGLEARLGKRVAGGVDARARRSGVWRCAAGETSLCAPRQVPAGSGRRPRRASYRAATPAMAKARNGALDRARRWPAPRPDVRLSAALVSEPVSLALGVDVTAASRPGARWTATGALPAGLALSPTGVLSGTVDAAGQWTIEYAVAGTTPTTTPHSGRVVLTVGQGATSVSAGGPGQLHRPTAAGAPPVAAPTSSASSVTAPRPGAALPAPVKGTGWERISTSGATTCGIKTGGTLWCWGLNNFAQLGNNTSAPRPKPQQVAAPAWSGSRWPPAGSTPAPSTAPRPSTAGARTCAARSGSARPPAWCPPLASSARPRTGGST